MFPIKLTLIAMQVIQQAFSHSSSSFMIGKIQGNIVDLLYAPLSATEVTISVSLAAVTRSFLIGAISILTFYFYTSSSWYKTFTYRYYAKLFTDFIATFVLTLFLINLERSPVEDALVTNCQFHTVLGSLCFSRHLVH